ncbi:MAG TPA: hypothetical protein VHX38_02245 [Pseudonocardiaceae bacterium]|nr:hypothetical protein [Pseudonocardiaceae bacterium]
MLDRTDPRTLPPYPFTVLRDGAATAAYRNRHLAELHAAPLEDARVRCDRGTGLVLPPPHRRWRLDAAVREQDRQIVEALGEAWLHGCNRY